MMVSVRRYARPISISLVVALAVQLGSLLCCCSDLHSHCADHRCTSTDHQHNGPGCVAISIHAPGLDPHWCLKAKRMVYRVDHRRIDSAADDGDGCVGAIPFKPEPVRYTWPALDQPRVVRWAATRAQLQVFRL